MAAPTSPPVFLRCKCVDTRLNRRALTYTMKAKKIEVAKVKTEMVSALSDGTKVYLNKKQGLTPEFEEGVSYILQNYTLSNTYGQMHLFVGPGTLKFKTVTQDISEEAQNAARGLCPSSASVTGGEEDLFSRGGYLSLQGQIKELRGVRMTRTHVPIQDLHLMCGEKVFEVSLWRDEALSDLYAGDEVIITHLRPCILNDGRGKFHSSTYTTVKIAQGQVQETVAEVIGVSEIHDTCHFLTSDSMVYVIPEKIYAGNIDDLISKLWYGEVQMMTVSKTDSHLGSGMKRNILLHCPTLSKVTSIPPAPLFGAKPASTEVRGGACSEFVGLSGCLCSSAGLLQQMLTAIYP